MDDQPTAVQSTPEQVNPVDASPAPEPQAPIEPVSDASPSATEASEAPDDALPTDPSEQAKAFQRMRQEQKRLKEELAQYKPSQPERKESVFQQVKSTPTDIDQTVEAKIDEIRAKEKYPQLDPDSSEFDPAFEEEVASRYFFDLYRGKQTSLVKIASDLATRRGHGQPDVKKVQQETIKQVKESLTEKEQAALAATAKVPASSISSSQRDALRLRARQGDDWALAELLKNAR